MLCAGAQGECSVSWPCVPWESSSPECAWPLPHSAALVSPVDCHLIGEFGNRVCTRISLCSYPISCLLRKVIADSSEYNYKSAIVDFSLCSPLDATKVILPPVLPCYTLLIKIDNLIDSVAQSNTRRPIVKELKNNIWPKPNFIRSSCIL